jgi:hypothetical protein
MKLNHSPIKRFNFFNCGEGLAYLGLLAGRLPKKDQDKQEIKPYLVRMETLPREIYRQMKDRSVRNETGALDGEKAV